MYVRTVQRTRKDGTSVRYVQLAHNYRDPATGQPKAEILKSLGRDDEVDVDALKRLVRSVERYLSPEDGLQRQAAEAHGDEVRLLDSRPFGGAWVLQQLWSELGLGRAVEKVAAARAFQMPVERALFAMVANRALAPGSKLAVEEWVREDVALPGLQDVPVHQLYRAMDLIHDAEDEVQREIYYSVADLLNLEVDLLFFDTTSSYFEIEGEDQEGGEDEDYVLRRRGHSKDHRPDLAQVVIGLAVTREGIPIRCWVWPGNAADVARVQEVKRDLIGWRLGRVVTVLDRGFMSEENLRELQRAGGHYIVGERMQSGKEAVEAALARPGRYQKVRDNVEVKEVVVGDGEARIRYIMVRNPQQEARDRQEREQLLERLKAELERLRSPEGGGHGKDACRLLTHTTYGPFLKQGKDGLPRIDRDKVKSLERLDGKYLLRTSDDTLAAADVALGYKQLLEVESAFRSLKQTLQLRPMHHRLSRRIRAHVVICWMALLLVRVAEHRAEIAMKEAPTWDRMRRELDRMHLGTLGGAAGTFQLRSETRPFQAQLFTALKVPEPPKVHTASTPAAL